MSRLKLKEPASIELRKKLDVSKQSIELNNKSKFWTSIFLKKTTVVKLQSLKARRRCRSYNELLLKMMKDLEDE